MKKKYYCDYCDKHLKNDLKRKHFVGAQHQMAKTKHYAKFRDLKTIFTEESAKSGQCYKFHQLNYCQFDQHCRYSHYTIDQLNAIKKQLDIDLETDLRNKKPHTNEEYFNAFIDQMKNNLNEDIIRNDPVDLIIQIQNPLPISLQRQTDHVVSQYSDNWSDWG